MATKDASDWKPLLGTEQSRGFYSELLENRDWDLTYAPVP